MSDNSDLKLTYQTGFRSDFATEALSGALPVGQNSPQECAYGLYAEQISGTAFTLPRHQNLRTWTYRTRPSVVQGEHQLCARKTWHTPPDDAFAIDHPKAGPNPLRWDPIPEPEAPVDFVESLFTMCGSGDSRGHGGISAHQYAFSADMVARFLVDTDGELLIVPQQGALLLRTELGLLDIAPGEIAVIPRGVRFQVRAIPTTNDESTVAKGYVCENYGAAFQLPELGPIGSNGLANPRDFETPVAYFEDDDSEHELFTRQGGRLWRSTLSYSALNVVAWHGNFAPYKYDLARFNTINTVSFDHPDPSIFTVLTSPSEHAGLANCDFVIFPPRWMVADHTFRPPWFHRNIMSEFVGLIKGVYDGKMDGFPAGACSLHNCMSPHGPDRGVFDKASSEALAPRYLADTLAFMFESRFLLEPTRAAMEASFRQEQYRLVWQDLAKNFDPLAEP